MASQNCNPVAVQLTKNQVIRSIDKLAALKAQISNLEHEADNLSDLLKAQGNGVYFGNGHKFHVSEVTSNRLDTQLAKTFLSPCQFLDCLKTTSATSGRLYAL